MKLTVVKSKSGYKVISDSTRPHPFLEYLAKVMKQANKVAKVKVGIYSVTGGEFESTKRVYSYISGKVAYMTRDQYYRFMRGEISMPASRPWAARLTMSKKDAKELEDLFGDEEIFREVK